MGARQGDRRLLVCPELARRELYDDAADPRETRDLLAGDRDTAARLADELAAQHRESARIAAGYTAGGTAELSPAESENLKSLGYIQ